MLETDIVVVGAGAAGLYAALCAAREGARVVLISATPLAQTASYWAQGGLAAALAADDSFELHLADTERAGRALVRRSAAEILVREAPARVEDLQALGVHFDGDRSGGLALGLEGGHSVRRVVHAGGSATGRRVVRQLSALVAEEPLITVFEGARARALWTDDGAQHPPHAENPAHPRCRGLICDDGRIVSARAVVLGTGGAAALWARTTNPPGSQGFGLLLAHAAGASLADLELLQFHPTAVIGLAGREGFLITEAIRGEGATLHDAAGERFVDELAPRDEVSRAIALRLQETGERSVGLDMRAIDPAHFPNVVAALREAGPRPDARAGPGRPGGPLHDGRNRRRPARALDPARAVCGRRVLLHRPARRQPPRLELAQRVLRLRPPRHSARALRARARHHIRLAGARSRRSAALPSPPLAGPATREALWRDAGIVRSAEGLQRAARGSPPAGPAARARRARAHREPRRPPALGPSASAIPRSISIISSSPATGDGCLADLGLSFDLRTAPGVWYARRYGPEGPL